MGRRWPGDIEEEKRGSLVVRAVSNIHGFSIARAGTRYELDGVTGPCLGWEAAVFAGFVGHMEIILQSGRSLASLAKKGTEWHVLTCCTDNMLYGIIRKDKVIVPYSPFLVDERLKNGEYHTVVRMCAVKYNTKLMHARATDPLDQQPCSSKGVLRKATLAPIPKEKYVWIVAQHENLILRGRKAKPIVLTQRWDSDAS
jgi:hypothetical protein